MGLGSYGTREIARRPERARQLLGEIAEVRAFMTLLVLSAVVAFAWWVDKPLEVKLLLVAFGVSLMTLPLLTMWFFQANQKMHWVAAVNLARHVTFTAIVLSAVRPDSPLWMIGAAETAALTMAAMLGLLAMKFEFGHSMPAFRPNLRRSLGHLRAAVPIGLADLGWAALWQSPMIILGLRVSDDSLGWFGAAHRCTMALHTFVWWYFYTLLPAVSRTVNEPTERLREIMAPSLKLAAWAGIFVALVGGFVASDVLGLAYGAPFAQGGGVLAVLLWSLPVAALCGHFRATLIGYGLQRLLLQRTFLAVGVAVVVAYLLAPRFGILAGALGLVAGNVVLLGLAYRVTARKVIDQSLLGAAAVPALAAALAYALSTAGGRLADLAAAALFSLWMLWANRDQVRELLGRLKRA